MIKDIIKLPAYFYILTFFIIVFIMLSIIYTIRIISQAQLKLSNKYPYNLYHLSK